MDRLTKKDYMDWSNGTGYYNQKQANQITEIEHKLGKLEDIMEKYDIESVEELDRLINVWKLRDVVDKMEKPINSLCEKAGIVDIEHDRDIWKKACELACEKLRKYTNGCKFCPYSSNQDCIKKKLDCVSGISNYFYQQAQKESK